MEHDTKKELIEKVLSIARELGTNTVSRPDFLRLSGLSERKILRLFGSYNNFIEAAGLVPRRFPSSDAPIYSDDDILNEIVRVLRQPDSKLTRIYFEQNSGISTSACERRFGGWINALKSAASRLEVSQDAALLARIQEYTAPAIPPPRRSKQPKIETPSADAVAELAEDESSEPCIDKTQIPSFTQGNIYGDFINFRGLQHAPVNEQGVVFLFGMICRELGYVVEIVKQGFPDCEAKRLIRPGIWQRVRIEFEFQSRTFRSHGHDPDRCDLIVCWDDNWPDCPLEVLELSTALKRLSPTLGSD
jgi:hypothetical protein